jgi:predicted nucleotidyltransferase
MSDELHVSNVPLPPHTMTILRAVVGSTVHGTNVSDQDDRDEMAIAIPPPAYVLGLQHWETTVIRTKPDGVRSGPGDLDLAVHSLRKYCQLSAKGNPTMLLPLFVPDSAIVEMNVLGNELQRNRTMFISRDAGTAFMGYLNAQRKRFTKETGGRHGKPRQELIDKYGYDTKYAGHVVRLALQGIELMETGELSLPMRQEHREEIVAIRTGRYSYEDTVLRTSDLETVLRVAIAKTSLPAKSDAAKIDEFLRDAYLRAWGALWHRLDPSPVERINGLPEHHQV